jgi:hypothetical protein
MTLREKIEKYVEENVVNLLGQLWDMAALRSRDMAGGGSLAHHRGNVFDIGHTFALVAGQASQFKPIGRALESKFGGMDIPPSHVYFLEGSLAKEACCIGAVVFQRSKHKLMNREELHGTYGFLRAVRFGNDFRAVNMSKIRKGGNDLVSFPYVGEYWLIYSPRPDLSKGQPPRLHDGATALIQHFEGSEFRVEYDPAERAIKINGEPINKLGTYGYVNESIYPKVWPEVLEPKK